jgi:hypothetical protein
MARTSLLGLLYLAKDVFHQPEGCRRPFTENDEKVEKTTSSDAVEPRHS